MDSLVPVVDSLAEVYSDVTVSQDIPSAVKSRWAGLLSQFSKIYGPRPDFIARSPGRVNVIGEHIDYSLYDVLPMAVTADVLVAVTTTPSTKNSPIRLANLDQEKFPSREFTVPADGYVEIDASKHDWTNYFKAGLRGALEFLRKRASGNLTPVGMDVMVDGNVPAGGGMSSSAALVCASAVAVLIANGHEAISKRDLFELAVTSERLVGVFAGGMDQAASIFSTRDHLLDCSFFPTFNAQHVPVPPSSLDVTFLVAQSFIAADKHVTAPRQYNLRVVECTLATLALAKMCGVELQIDPSPLGYSLRGLQEGIMRKCDGATQKAEEQLAAMISVIEDNLEKEDGYTRDDLAHLLGMTVTSLGSTYMSKFPVQADKFQLRRRALHVFSEAKRVSAFKSILSEAQTSHAGLGEMELRSLGDLMNETQRSCSEDYDCSAPELDDICRIAARAGTYGSRLMGAGWGGCTIHLLPRSMVESVTEALKEQYYLKHFPDMTDEKLDQAMVLSKPSAGSMVIFPAALANL